MSDHAQIHAAADRIMGLADSQMITHGQVQDIIADLIAESAPHPPTDAERRKFTDALNVFDDPRRSWEERCGALRPFGRFMRALMAEQAGAS